MKSLATTAVANRFETLETLESRRLLSVSVPQWTPSVSGATTVAHANKAKASVPKAPANVSATADASAATVRVRWSDVATNETGYTVQRRSGRHGAWTTVATLPANATSYRATGLAAGTAYAFRVAAFNRKGASGWSAAVAAKTASPATAPKPQQPTLPALPRNVATPVHQVFSSAQIPAGEPALDDSGAMAAQWVNVSKDALFAPGGPTAEGVVQGVTGDCYLLAALAEIARDDPAAIKNMVRQNGDGTYTVTFQRYGSPVNVKVDGYMPAATASRLSNANFGNDGSVWAAVVEKAFTYFRMADGTPSYADIANGDELTTLPMLGFDWMAGKALEFDNPEFAGSSPFTHVTSADALFNDIRAQLDLGRAVLYSTVGANVAAGPMLAAHVYGIYSATKDAAGNEYVIVRNPWGSDGPRGDGYSVVSATALFTQFFRVDVAIV